MSVVKITTWDHIEYLREADPGEIKRSREKGILDESGDVPHIDFTKEGDSFQ